MSWFSLFSIWFVVAVSAVFASEISLPIDDKTKVLLGRIGPPSQKVIQEFEKAGMVHVRNHEITQAERLKIGSVLASLPEVYRDILVEHLDRLSFLDGIPGEGTGLTAPADKDGDYTITFRASIIDESLSQYLTTKERRLFKSVDGGPNVTITADGLDALPFAFLHESTHVVDNTFGIKRNSSHPLISGIWEDTHRLKPAYAQSVLASTAFRGGAKIPAEQAQAVYDAMVISPFVSLYSTAAASEDIAELVAWYVESKRCGVNLVIQVSSEGGAVKRFEPLKSTLVVERFLQVQKFLSTINVEQVVTP